MVFCVTDQYHLSHYCQTLNSVDPLINNNFVYYDVIKNVCLGRIQI